MKTETGSSFTFLLILIRLFKTQDAETPHHTATGCKPIYIINHVAVYVTYYKTAYKFNMDNKSNSFPIRSFMDTKDIEWRHGSKPDYSVVNEKFMNEITNKHPEGSLEKTVEDLVKTWEMESSHKPRAQDWGSVDQNVFYINSNCGKKFNLADNIEIGNYNILMHDSVLYDSSTITNDASHELFRKVFKSGFPWEVLEVFSGPPNVAFTWRHWGTFEGDYKQAKATGETLEMFGSCFVKVTDELKIQSIEVFYDPNVMLKELMAKGDKASCPFHHPL